MSRIELVVAQAPDGFTAHSIKASPDTSPPVFKEVGRLEGFTHQDQTLVVDLTSQGKNNGLVSGSGWIQGPG